MLDLNSIEYLQTVEGLEALYGDGAVSRHGLSVRAD